MFSLRTVPRTDSAFDLADWVETRLLSSDPWRVTEANFRTYLERHGILEGFESSIANAVLVMRRRARRLGDLYPFDSSSTGIRRLRTPPRSTPYIALLSLSQVEYDSSPEALLEAATMFERFCEQAFLALGGAGGHSVHFGWPNRSGRPEAFPAAIRWLSELLHLSVADGYRDPHRRDGGVDLVLWRSLPDGKTFDYRLVQCTVGRNVLSKSREIDITQWLQWLSFHERPRISLAVPFQTPERSVEVRQAEQMGSIVLDRMRLVEQAAHAAPATERICQEVLAATRELRDVEFS